MNVNDVVQANIAEDVVIEYADTRLGDVLHSLADISAAAGAMSFKPGVAIEAGLREYVSWARQEVSGRA